MSGLCPFFLALHYDLIFLSSVVVVALNLSVCACGVGAVYMRQLYKTGLTSAALDKKQSQRMFEAIEGERKGEL